MKLLCISLGCDKNLVDTEMMLGLLNRDGYTFTDDEYEADVIVINTCCFIGDAKEESVNTILEMAQMKEVGKCKALIVTGRPRACPVLPRSGYHPGSEDRPGDYHRRPLRVSEDCRRL